MTLREIRKQKGLSQAKCASFLDIPLRTYQNYETDLSKAGSMKYSYMLEKLSHYGYVDENTGLLSRESITDKCKETFSQYPVDYCYLFGSYAKNTADEKSDVDLLISTPISGMKFYGLVETLREKLCKKVDVLNFKQLNDNPDLINEILKYGVKIYG